MKQPGRQVMVVVREDRRDALLAAIRELDLSVCTASNRREARACVRQQPGLKLIVSDLTLEDGNWWRLYQDLSCGNSDVGLVVVLPRRAGGVEQILGHGAVGVLHPPYERDEIRRIVESALARAGALGRATVA